MYYEISYGKTGEIFSSGDYASRYPYRERFSTREEMDAWCEEAAAKGWIIGDENVCQGFKDKAEYNAACTRAYAVGKAYDAGRRNFNPEEEKDLALWLSWQRPRAWER